MVFDSLLAVRQAHGVAFGKSDIFMLCGATLSTKYDAASASGRPALQPCEQVQRRTVLVSAFAVQAVEIRPSRRLAS